jgi:hypothetical protein
MRMTTAGTAEHRPRRFLINDVRWPAASFHRRELAAGIASAAVVAQLVLAPVTLPIAAVLTLAGRRSRWRPAWLLLPAAAGACWLAAVTIPASVAALEAGSHQLVATALAVALHRARQLHPVGRVGVGRVGAAAGAGWWLPRELPLALLAGTAEAAVMLWLGWRRSAPNWRPGAIALVRRRAAVAALAAARTVTANGCAIGLDPSSGRLAGFSWAEAQHGILLVGPDESQLGQLGLAVACAAVRLRKTVIVIDSSDGPQGSDGPPGWGGPPGSGRPAGQIALLAQRLGVPVTQISALDGDAAGRMGRAIRSRRVVIVAAGQPEPARQAVGNLASVLADLRDLGLRGDCLAWLSGCDRVDLERVSGLLELGPATGTSILLSSTSMTYAASLASRVATMVECGHRPVPAAFTLVSARHPEAPTCGLLVPIVVGHAR